MVTTPPNDTSALLAQLFGGQNSAPGAEMSLFKLLSSQLPGTTATPRTGMVRPQNGFEPTQLGGALARMLGAGQQSGPWVHNYRNGNDDFGTWSQMPNPQPMTPWHEAMTPSNYFQRMNAAAFGGQFPGQGAPVGGPVTGANPMTGTPKVAKPAAVKPVKPLPRTTPTTITTQTAAPQEASATVTTGENNGFKAADSFKAV